MFLEKFKNSLGNSFFHGHKEHDRDRVERDWASIIIFFVIVVASLVAFSAYLFLQVNQGAIFVTTNEEEITTNVFDEVMLKDTLDTFGEKKRLYEELKNSVGSVPRVD